MKSAAVLIIGLCAGSLTVRSGAQIRQTSDSEGGGEYPIHRNTATKPCVSDEQYRLIEQECEANIKALDLSNTGAKQAATSLIWPLRTAAGINECSYYGIGAYVDQDTSAAIKDFNCGSNTYNGHKGTDIFVWPYPFYKMDHNHVEVIAAAPGNIVGKADGNFDRNCGTNSLNPNYITIQHADGSRALYLHMKSGSLTTKGIGATVVSGEYLGIVGSSGSSSGPHLHFEVWTGTTSATRIDPYSGTCNTLNSSSWWASQKPHSDPYVVKASIHKPAPVIPGCPTTETPNEDTCYAPGASVVFAIFMRDETMGTTVNMSLLSPSGTTLSSWVHNCNTTIAGSYWTYSRTLPVTPGIYTFKSVYNGNTCTKTFKVDCNYVPPAGTGALSELQSVRISPNPAHDVIAIIGEGLEPGTYILSLEDISGRLVAKEKANVAPDHKLLSSFSLQDAPQGMYFLSIKSGNARMIKQVIKLD